ncbi:MAG: FHA domain-containing protein [Proteobacteria bacterium]|nr:FHA domain-containing protein [Pseudomonadota bacterium]
MAPPFTLVARSELTSAPSGKSTLWASLRVDPQGRALEADRAPLAVVMVIDTSGSMQGDPLHHVVKGCELLASLLGERDQLAIVSFADHAGVRCGLTTTDAPGRAAIATTLRGITAHGSTNMHGGLEVAAGVLMTAPAGLRRVMVVMSDGQPNVGISSAEGLARYVAGLKLATSTLGFGLHHDENVLDAIAVAGSGRYAYIPDPIIARVELARAALAHGGIVADQLELRIKLADGVELLQVLPATKLRHGGSGVAASLGDVFIDEGRVLAIELALDLTATATGRLAEISVDGRGADGKPHHVAQTLAIDIRTGPPGIDRDAQRDVIGVQAEASRHEARLQADRGAHPAAAALLQALVERIGKLDGFVKNDGSPIAELYEQLVDEVANYSRKSTAQEYAHQRKAATAVRAVGTVMPSKLQRAVPAIRARLVGMNHVVAGQQFELFDETVVGRGSSNDIFIANASLSRRHGRILFITDHYVIQDLGATNGTLVNGQLITSAVLADGDEITFGDVQLRFELL